MEIGTVMFEEKRNTERRVRSHKRLPKADAAAASNAGSQTICVGSRWTLDGRTLRVMAVAEGNVMYRFKGRGVNVVYWKDFIRKYSPQNRGA